MHKLSPRQITKQNIVRMEHAEGFKKFKKITGRH